MIIGIRSFLHTYPHRTVAFLATIAIVAGALLLTPAPTKANGVPVTVDLSYIDLSNWGPEDASGSAELIFAEGIVRITAQGLPRLTDTVYQAWLVNSQVGDAISAGRFNATVTGTVNYQGSLPPISDFGFDLLILTVEPDPDDAPQPTQNRSIGGYFSLIGVASPDGAGGEATSGALLAPGTLPNTGDAAFVTDMIRVGALAAAMALSVVVGLRLSRRTA